MSGKLNGKVAVITGGSSGIGLASARLFLEEGAEVVITGRNEERLAEAQQHLNHKATAITSDAAVLADIDNLFAQVKEKHGGFDVLFVNAGVGTFQPISMVDEETFDRMININLKGLFFTIQKALPLMREGGSIILNTSVAGQKGFATTSVYSATKAAVRSLARTLSAELVEQGIRVNAIAPGPIDTPIFEKLGVPSEDAAAMKDGFRQQVPLQRMGRPEEIGHYAVFLASDESAYVVGTELAIDGGISTL